MTLWTRTLDLLFPPKCPFCRTILEQEGELLCPKCQMTLPWLIGRAGERELKGSAGCCSPLEYQGLVAEAVQRYKFSGLRCYHKAFGRLMAQCALDHRSSQVDGVTWAPLSRKRLRERGYDQAQLLARTVGQELSLPVLSTLRKVRNTPPQSGQESGEARRSNVTGAYEPVPRGEVRGKRLLLVDDVVTSGATLEACVAQLRLAGAEAVWCLTLAQAGKGRGKIKEKMVENNRLTDYNEE